MQCFAVLQVHDGRRDSSSSILINWFSSDTTKKNKVLGDVEGHLRVERPIYKNKKTWRKKNLKRSIVLTLQTFSTPDSILLLQVPVTIVSPLSAAAFVSQQHGAAPNEVPLLFGLPRGELFEPRLAWDS